MCLLAAFAVLHTGLAGDAKGWRRRVIYQVLQSEGVSREPLGGIPSVRMARVAGCASLPR